MKNKVQFGISLAISLVGILSVPASLLSFGFAMPSQFEETFLGEFKYKVERLEKVEGKKIVFIGGSSVPFALRSELIEKNIEGYEIVDFGLYAGLGTKVMMDASLDSIKKDDIVILMPEQQEQTLSTYFNANLMWQALDGEPSLMMRLSEEERTELVKSYPTFALSKANYYFTKSTPKPNDIYKRSSFDEYGDISSDLPAYNNMPGFHDENMPILFNDNVISDDFISYMNDYNDKIQSKGATLYYHYSPMNRLAVQDSFIEYHKSLRDKLDFQILGNPGSCIMDYEYFYDTNFHLNNAGAINYTRNMIRDLKILFSDTSEINFPYAKKPISPIEEERDGDNQDVDCFEYQVKDDRARVSSLLDIKERMIIPYRYQGKRIDAFTKETFQNVNGIKTILIQDNISSISDESFANCGDLKRIELKNNVPSSIRVGRKLLEGTSANIYVPKEALSLYKTNYFWSEYTTRIYSLEDK
ncbi:MAG: leucine-rich repeat domain-containing protein [Bacilli bacterium]|nr:leucine-rich repeat domain-containing protein [Bacilli bacterium]